MERAQTSWNPRAFVVSTLIGLLFASFFAIDRPDVAGRIVIGGGLTGAFICTVIALLENATRRRVDALGPRQRLVAKAVIFALGGTIGWIVGMSATASLLGVGFPLHRVVRGPSLFLMGVVGAVAVAVGLSFYAYELLTVRLERTLEQLKEREWAEKELELARAVQSRLLPPPLVRGEGFIVSARNLPARMVAGDFYDIVRLDDGSVVIVVADVAGKGIAASLIMASVKAVLPFVAHEEPRRAMSLLNTKLVQELGRREFVALAYARLRPSDGTLEMLNGGFPDAYVISPSGVRTLVAPGMRLPLGIRADAAYEPLVTTIARGERVLFVSDGIPEAPFNGEPLGYEQLAHILGAAKSESDVDRWLDLLLDDVRTRVDAGLADDWTAVVVERL